MPTLHKPSVQFAPVKRGHIPGRAWYSLAVWRRLRRLVLERDAYVCQACGCSAGASAHVDHIVPHQGAWKLFMEERNLQTLCAVCHGKKTAEEGS